MSRRTGSRMRSTDRHAARSRWHAGVITRSTSQALTPMTTSRPAVTREELQLIRSTSARLQRDFEGIFGFETIQRVMIDSFERLSDARIRTYIPLMAERFTRDRLRAAAKIEGTIVTDAPAVLFLCVHNAGRSHMAPGRWWGYASPATPRVQGPTRSARPPTS